MKRDRYRLAIVNSHPTQYFAPLYRTLAAHPGIDLEVFFPENRKGRGALQPEFGVPITWDVPTTEGYPHRFLPNHPLPLRPRHVWANRCPELSRILQAARWNAVFAPGYATFLEWQTFQLALRRRIPFLMRPEGADAGQRRGVREAVRSRVLRFLYGRAGALLAIGRHAETHLLKYGGDPSKIFFSPYCVDNAFFRTAADALPDKAVLRRQWGLEKCRHVVMFCARLTPRKQPELLLEALQRLPGKSEVGLLVVGDGPLMGTLRSKAAAAGLGGVHFAGFQNQSALSRYYKSADIFVLPSSYETWGLVVNEAMNFGLACITSDVVGCAPDLIAPDDTGLQFRSGDAGDLARALQSLFDSGERLRSLGERARLRVEKYGLEQAAEGFYRALASLPTPPT